ncbi:MAG: response regulator [Bacteroidia bacterium]|nr:response regulator [Bacteroidia bacterium]
MTHKILFADEDYDFETLIRQTFKQEIRTGEIEVLFVYDAERAIEKIRSEDLISLVYADWDLPKGGGLKVLERVRELDLPDRILKLGLFSGNLSLDQARTAMKLGAFDIISKPIEMEEMRRSIWQALEEVRKVSAGKEAAKELEETMRARILAEESEKLKEDFFSNVAHELRTPLTLIVGPLEKLIPEVRDPEHRDKLNTILRNGRRLLELGNQLLDISKLEANNMRTNLFAIDLVRLAEEIMSNFSILAEEKGVVLKTSFHKPSFITDLDPGKMVNIINNLVSNAIKFTLEGGSVSLRIFDPGKIGTIGIAVKDTGIGIPANLVDKIFDRFYQVDRPWGKQIKGTGIGLSLVYQLVKLHDGDITCQSIEGIGTEFTILLPVRHTGADPIGVEDLSMLTGHAPEFISPIEREPDAAPEISEDDDDSKPLIAVIEDNPEMRDYIADILGDDYLVAEAGDGIAGVKLVREKVPDLVITDIMLPGISGYEVCKILKTEETTSHIPVIMLTAKVQVSDRITGLEQGADDYLTKPFYSRELLSRVKNLIELRKLLFEKYRSDLLLKPGHIEAKSMEESFLLKVKEVVQQHIKDDQFGVEQLCYEIGLSRTQVHRKLTALTGNSASHFIRVYRLETAMDLLRQNAAPIGEIAYLVGFSSPSYFTKCFTEQFGITPREVKKV